MKNKRISMIWAALFGLLFIVACGGGGGGDASYVVITEPNASLSSTSHNFGGVVVNNNADRQFTITNDGTHSGLEIGVISSSTAVFSILRNTCSGSSLAMGASCTFIARFSPTVQGLYNGTISVISNDPPTRVITLQGEGFGLNVWINQDVVASCSSVVVDVTVTNPNGILDVLQASNFTLTQDGVVQTGITGFINIDPDPVSAVVTLDLSSSLTSAITNIKAGAKSFIDLLRNEDEASICKFRNEVNLYPATPPLLAATDATGKTNLKNYIDLAFSAPDGTALYDAVYDSITRAMAGTKSKKAVIVLSDGSNQKTTGKTLAEVIAYAKAQQIPIFTIYYVDSTYANDAKPAIMKQLAEETGGQDFYADTSTMEFIFGQISSLLSKKYTITYTPTSCTGSPLLEVEVLSDGLTGMDARTIVFP